MKNKSELAKIMLDIGKRVYHNGWVASNDGNFSAVLDNNRVLVTPTRTNKADMTEDMLTVVDFQWQLIEGHCKPSSEIPMHLKIYEWRPDVRAVVHAHPPYATAFAVAGIALDRPILPEAVLEFGRVPIAPYATPGTEELALSLMTILQDHDVFLLKNHGVVAVGEDLMTAYYKMESLELLCKVIHLAKGLGSIDEIPADKVDELYALRTKYGVKGRQPKWSAVIILGSIEAEPQYVRYFSDYWPSFETAGVLIPKQGEPFLLIGPESMTYAKDRSKIPNIRRLRAFRESSEPDYPDAKIGELADVFREILGGAPLKRLGVVGWGVISHIVMEAIREAIQEFDNVEVVKADRIVNNLKSIKSENELNIMREANRIAKIGFEAVLANIRPGMTETQVRGIALAAMYDAGAEAEAYPMWTLSGEGSEQAISRPRHKPLGIGEIIQVQVGCRVAGYTSTIGRPLVFGKASPEIKSLIEAGFAGQQAILRTVRAGIPAKQVDEAYRNEMKKLGYHDWVLYGPCHGTGLMEGEPPWMESHSEWILKENMTFAVDVYLGSAEKRMGLRVEDVIRITKDGCEEFYNERRGLIEL